MYCLQLPIKARSFISRLFIPVNNVCVYNVLRTSPYSGSEAHGDNHRHSLHDKGHRRRRLLQLQRQSDHTRM